jgi:putative membrane protein
MDSLNNISDDYKRLPPLWIIFKAFQSLKEIIFFGIFLSVISGTRYFPLSFTYVKWIIVIYSIYKIIAVVFEWKHFRYKLDNKGIHIKSGRFIRTSRYVPYERIQGINEYTPFFHRLIGLTILLLDVGGNDQKGSIKLDMLTHKNADEIKRTIANFSSISLEEFEQTQRNKDRNQNYNTQRHIHYEISNKEIIIGSIVSLKMLLFFTFLFSIYENFNNIFSIELKLDSILSFFSSTWWSFILGILLLVIFSTIYGIITTYLRFGRMKVTSDYNRIYITKGIFNKTEYSIPKNKIQAVSINYSFLQKLTGLVKVRIISTIEKDNEEVPTSNILFPFINKDKAKSLINEMLPEFRVHKDMIPIPKTSIIVKLLRTSYVWLLTPILVYFFFPSFWYLTVLISLYILISQIIGGLYNSYSLKSESIQLKKCTLFINIFITSHSKVEEFNFSQSLLQRFFGLASFPVTTKENPVKITKMLDVPFEVAREFYVRYKEKTTYFTNTLLNK